MMDDNRPDPDQLLAHVQREETRLARGRLKIFLGYAAGVGKTYAMIEAARQRLGEGIDIVAAYVETHGRSETEALLSKMEVIPREQVAYRGITLPEMNLDAVLARRPTIALVDELAHTNAPGSRHAKRYQDVLELLDAGIDVYTTLNIQHLESLNDVVAQITGVVVRETVPDHILDEADDVELIDLPIDELLQRLEEGKVYVPEQAARAVRKFFRPGNLAALREISLRRTADQVDGQMRSYMQTHAIPGPWPASERLLVCVGPSPLSERLVRTARRLAAHLDAEWFAVYVETPGHARLSQAARDQVARTLGLAEELGAKSVRLPGRSVAEAIIDYARSYNVTKIVAGKPLQPRWVELLRGSIVDQIIHHSHDIDVYVISGLPELPEAPPVLPSSLRSRRWRRFGQSAILVAIVTLLGLPLRPLIEPTNLVMLYLLAVIVAAIRLGRSPAILASVLSVVAFDVFFVPPYYTFVVADAEYLLTFAALLGVSLIVSTLTAQAREQARAAQRREAHTAVLYELSRDLAAAGELDHVAQIVVRHVEQILGGYAVVLVYNGEQLELRGASTGHMPSSDEYAVATWAFQHSQPAGRYTSTLAGADGYYLPLKTAQEVVGVLGVTLAGDPNPITPEQQRLLQSFASQAALAIERSQLAEQAKQAELLHETEKLQTALLNSISHDLRTPLASITGALTSLRDDIGLLDERSRRDLVNTAYEEADRLNRLVGNLLDMTRLEAGAMKVSAEPGDVQDAIGVALSQLSNRLLDRPVLIDVPRDLPLVPMDFVLVVQVLVNLLDNADKYSPTGAPIEIKARTTKRELVVEVADYGPGIPEAETGRIFEKFHRVQRPGTVSGTGLGLSISKGIIEAHGGRISARNRAEGGALFTVTLPLQAIEQRAMEAVP
ncbi:MAG TPA: sensor histidine kinase KdpD [Anaerolineae bacterium]